MIAGNGSIVLEVVHDVDDVLALGERADHTALNMVARVNEQIRALVQRCDLGILLVVAVNIVGVQNGDVLLGGGGIPEQMAWKCMWSGADAPHFGPL